MVDNPYTSKIQVTIVIIYHHTNKMILNICILIHIMFPQSTATLIKVWEYQSQLTSQTPSSCAHWYECIYMSLFHLYIFVDVITKGIIGEFIKSKN